MTMRKVTIDDIARVSNASPTTVSLVLRDKPGIGVETRERVLAAAQELGYRRRTARPRDEERSHLTVALLFRTRTRSIEDRMPGVNPFYSWVLTGLEASARSKRMNLLYGTLPVDDRNEVTDMPTHILNQTLDGALVIGPFADETLDTILGSFGFPMVLVDAPAIPRRFDVVASDNVDGARIAVHHLIDLGHRHIGLLAPEESADPNFHQRAEGYERAIRDAGLMSLQGRYVNGDIAAEVSRFLRLHPDVTALFCVNDFCALSAIKIAIGEGRRIPETLSVVGFDDIDQSRQSMPTLTTMAVDKVGMGRRAVEVLDFRISWPEAATTVTTLSPRLVIRESSGPPARTE
jgi:LacI family transcriptional regulator